VISAVVRIEDGRLDCSPYRIGCISEVCAAVVGAGQYNALAETRKHDRKTVQDHTYLEALEDRRQTRRYLRS
jgi:hypothetical protein